MSETLVRVDLRQATLSENARISEAGELMFLALENPPPVRCLLRITEGEEEAKVFEVARVIEVVDDIEPARGCYGRYVDLERLEEQTKVGSEHLEVGISGGGGVPAPVLIMNTSEMMIGEDGELPPVDLSVAGEGESGEADESSEAEPGESSEAESGESSEAESGESSEAE